MSSYPGRDFKHGQVTMDVAGNKSIYCEPHDKLFRMDLDGLCDHPCFHGIPKILTDLPKPGFSFSVNKEGHFDFFSAERLVAEWYNWWAISDIAPNKLPDSLHTRSAIYLAQRKSNDR